jgi:DNA repair protein RecN (Recombination protein N)
MLSLLRVRDYALIDTLDVEFGSGLNVLTGETGSGKSVLVESLQLLLGARANPASIRRGATCALIEGAVEIEADSPVATWLEQEGFDCEEPGEVLLRREIQAKGRSRAWINGRLATVAQLAALGAQLADWHGQQDTHSLADTARQGVLFDDACGLAEAAESVRKCWETASDVRARLEALDTDDRTWRARLDFLEFQIAEIENVSPVEGEDAALRAERERLAHAEELEAGANEALTWISDGADQVPAAADLVGQALARLHALAPRDAALAPIGDELAEVASRLDDVARSLRGYLGRMQPDPERLAEVNERLEALKRLERKHGAGAASLLAALEQLRAEAEELRGRDVARDELEAARARAEGALAAAAATLTKKRRAAASGFARKVRDLVRGLAMPKAEFEVAFRPPVRGIALGAEGSAACGAHGAERVEFHFSANPGEAPAPLAEIASGGELARVLLALRATTAGADKTPILVFDEIDAGISGEAALRVGEALVSLARGHQVMCVTHQASVAARADRHLVVRKRERAGRTTTHVEMLDNTARREELARLLDGNSGSKSRELAEEMLAGVA